VASTTSAALGWGTFPAQKAMKARSGEALSSKSQPQVQKVFDIVKAVASRRSFRTWPSSDEYLDEMHAARYARQPVTARRGLRKLS
jgi:hypothetical protein